MIDRYQQENNELLNKSFNDMFVKTWKGLKGGTFDGLEIIVSGYCNLKCTYCYIHNFGHKLFPVEIRDNDKIVENAGVLFDWMIKNKITPRRVEFFSGEIFAQKVGFDTLEMCYNKYKDAPEDAKIRTMVIPTNFSFILSDELTNKVQSLIDRFKEIGIRLALSASFDGKYLESENRAHKTGLDFKLDGTKRDDKYYDKAFAFIAKNNCGLHPMVYSNGIERWKDNFLWFQQMMEKHGIHWTRLYLLQVRNVEWTQEQSRHLRDFVRFLYNWAFEKVNKDEKAMLDFLKRQKGFNILKTGMGSNGRGISCSIQSDPAVRLADLKLVPCHRLMYEGMEYGSFTVKEGKMTGELEAINPEIFFTIMSMETKNQPYCSVCAIRDICIGGCLGSQYEVTGDPFIPIPTVCAMHHALAAGIVEGLVDTGMFKYIGELANPEQVLQFKSIKEILETIKKGE